MKRTKNKKEQKHNHKIHKNSEKLNKHKIEWTTVTNQTNSCFKNEHETKQNKTKNT